MIPGLLAQSIQPSNVTQTIRLAFDALLTPLGLLAGLSGACLMILIVLRRDGAYIGGTIVIICMTMMNQENRYFDNTLILPLQKFRDFSKIITFCVLVATAVNLALTVPNGRARRVSFLMVAFFAFQTMFLVRLMYTGDVARAGLGWVSDLLLLLTFGIGFGKKLETDEDFERYLTMFSVASLVFIACNLVQLGLGYRYVIASNRFMGISGNPQLSGYVCAVFILINTHRFGRLKLGAPMRWVYAISVGILGLLLIWSGSRTAALCVTGGLLTYFRLRLGSFAMLVVVGGAFVLAAATMFSESFEGIARFVSGENTREGVWLKLIDEFKSAPVFGTMNLRADEVIGGAESTYLTTLSLMGISGFIPLVVVILAIFTLAARTFAARWAGKVVPEQADLLLGFLAILMIGSVFEGFFLGILAFAIVWMYSVFGLGAFVLERLSMPLNESDAEHDDELDTDQLGDDVSRPFNDGEAGGAPSVDVELDAR